jgi:hypothetical protein
MTTIERAKYQYMNNPLARSFVDVLHTQLEVQPTSGSVMMVLAHDGLLAMLELGNEQLQERLAETQKNGPASILVPPVEPKQIWLPR